MHVDGFGAIRFELLGARVSVLNVNVNYGASQY